jgi:hypothetical protein
MKEITLYNTPDGWPCEAETCFEKNKRMERGSEE